MATVIGNNQVKLQNGKIVNAQNGGWYDGQQYWNGQIGATNIIINPNQVGAGQQVSKEVVAQTNPNNVAYIQKQQQQPVNIPTPTLNTPLQTGTQSSQPTINLQDQYSKFYNSADIQQAKTDVENITKEYNDTVANFQKSQELQMDNPLISSTTLQGRVAALQRKQDITLQEIKNRLDTAANRLKTLQGDAETQFNLALKQYDINSQDYKNNLSNFKSLLEMGALTGADANTVAQYASSIGIQPSLMQNIINEQKLGKVKPQLVEYTDVNNNKIVAVIDANTGKTINTSVLGKTSGSNSTLGTVQNQQSDIADALSILKEIDGATNEDKLLSPDEFSQVYQNLVQKTGSEARAQAALNQAWTMGGYQKWNWK